ncbi:hypothetical protein SAMN06297144_1861 [Sphingomonas guangdongensis]|uniref:GDSL-like Lipase/Acylhydrolase family protein n=1 Tax=Sphingomonas guangdongensis TaxID=1141890 RepID=A0A285R332_9SPHN|nr:hypothetical protein [Sphingomonas guangdongensis]SOB86752.1 hypothetical protein SAMN06297144_1861 [Sphingomonas guangdongensis]
MVETRNANLPSQYLGQVATGCYMPRSSITGANRYARTRDMVITTEVVTNPKVGWARWRVASGIESAPAAACKFIAALEYPTGVFTYADQCIAAGTPGSPAEVDMAANATLLLDFAVTIPKGAQVYVWARQFSADGSGVLWRQGQHPLTARPGCYLDLGQNASPPALLNAFGGSPAEFSFPPVLFLGQTRRPSVLVFGDSREEGGTEGPRTPHYDNGLCIGAIGRHFGYTSVAESSSSLNQFTGGSSANRSNRLALAPYFTHIVNAWGVNDIGTGRTVAQFLADRATFAGYFPNKQVIGTTMPPYVPYTDGGRTIAGQSLGTNQPKVREANRAIRAGIAGEAFIFDTARGADPFDRDAYSVDPDPSATTARFPAAQITASISATTLTVTAVTSGTLGYGTCLTEGLGNAYDSSPYYGTMILEQLTGTTGGVGTYRVNFSQNTSWRTMYAGGWGSKDGLHLNGMLAEQVRERLAPAIDQIRR